MEKVRLAIVGCGNISQLNVPGYLQHPQCEVVALCDTVPSRAAMRAKQWDISPRMYTDYAQVLNDPHIDALELLTPSYLHAEQIIAGLEAGKHVSCQKPLCTTVAEADRIIAAVERAKTTFRITENFYYYPPIQKAKELLDAGAIGEPSLIRIHTTRAQDITTPVIDLDPEAYVWRRDPGKNPGGVLYDDGVHKYAVALLWGGDIEHLQAMVSETSDFIMETPSVAMWKFKRGDCMGIIDYTNAPQLTIRGKYVRVDEFFEIHGSKGTLWVTRCSGEMLDLPPVMLMKGSETVNYQMPMDWRVSFDGAAHDFIDSLLQGRQPQQDVHTAKKILQVSLAIYQASRLQRPVVPESVR